MTESDQPKIKVPRELRGRRARRLYREMAPLVHANGQYRADTSAVLAAYVACLVGIAERPNSFRGQDLAGVRQLGRLLGLLK